VGLFYNAPEPTRGYGHYTHQPALAGTSSQEMKDFVGAKFYCLHVLADGNQRIRVREKTLEFSAVLSTLSPSHCLIVETTECIQ